MEINPIPLTRNSCSNYECGEPLIVYAEHYSGKTTACDLLSARGVRVFSQDNMIDSYLRSTGKDWDFWLNLDKYTLDKLSDCLDKQARKMLKKKEFDVYISNYVEHTPDPDLREIVVSITDGAMENRQKSRSDNYQRSFPAELADVTIAGSVYLIDVINSIFEERF